jgi:hypothetical protein
MTGRKEKVERKTSNSSALSKARVMPGVVWSFCDILSNSLTNRDLRDLFTAVSSTNGATVPLNTPPLGRPLQSRALD